MEIGTETVMEGKKKSASIDASKEWTAFFITRLGGRCRDIFVSGGPAGSVAAVFILAMSIGLLPRPAQAAAAVIDVCRAYNEASPRTFMTTRQDGDWSDPATWGGSLPGRDDNVLISHRLVADEGIARQVQVRGSVMLQGTLDIHGSLLVCQDGRLEGNTGTLAIHVDNDRLFTGNAEPGPVASYPDFHPEDTGLWVLPGGSLHLAGDPVTSWLDAVALEDARTRRFQRGVLRTAAFDRDRARLAEAPVGWRAGDTLLLVNEKGEEALATLAGVSGQEITFQFQQPDSGLEGYVLSVDSDQEQRSIHPKVANLTRRLQIIAADVVPGDVNHRSHTAYLEHSSIHIESVEFRNLGPRAKLGRYPVHWHHNHHTDGVLSGSSIWQSVDDGGNRFVTMHMVSGATISDNVGYRSQGHGYFMEEVTEIDNRVIGNLSVDVRHGEELPNVDAELSNVTHHYWLRSGNLIAGNVAAGNSWDGKGRGNHTPPIEGIVVLPSSDNDEVTVVSDFECLGCGGVGMWTAVPDTVFENPLSSYAVIAGFRGYDAWNFDASGALLRNPLFILNGNNDLFSETRDYSDTVPWASQIYLNYGAVAVEGGALVGRLGVHSHYQSRFALKDTLVITNTAIDPTYWDTSAVVEGAIIDTDNLFTKGYGSGRRASPGMIMFRDACLKKRCRNDRALTSVSYTSKYYADMFENHSAPLGYGTWVEVKGLEGQTGLIKTPENVRAKYWSVTPAHWKNRENRITFIRENEAAWRYYVDDLGGYLDGFPPGDYRVNLYATENPDSLLDSQTVTVYPGQVTPM